MSTVNASPFPKRLKEARKKLGISQKALGMQAGIDELSASPRMNQYEKGKHYPDYDMARRLANVLQVPCSFFYEEDDEVAEMLLLFFTLSASDRKKIKASLMALSVDFAYLNDRINESNAETE